MSDLSPFRTEEFDLSIEMHDTDGFRVLAPGMARALGVADAYTLLRSIPEAEKGSALVRTPGGQQYVGYLTEAGFYRALGQRQTGRITDPELRARVERFQAWVYGTVLPEIRRTGSFNTALDLSDPIAAIEAVREREGRAIELAKSERAARLEAEAHARELEAPASAWKHLASAEGDYEVADAAKVLSRDPNIKIGRARLFAYMAALGWTYRNRATSRWKAYQTQVENGRLAERFGKPFLHEPSGEMRLGDPTIRITPKGMAELHKRLGGSGQLALVAAS